MKFAKTAILFCICLLMLCACFVSASAAQTGLDELAAAFTVGESTQTVRWWETDGNYFLFLPSDADLQETELIITADAPVLLDGETLPGGTTLADFTVGAVYTLTCGENTYPLTILQSENIPSLHITTENGMEDVHADKDHKEPADIVVFSDGEVKYEEELEYIKGRGNSTWFYDKKPYNIKFDSKIDLFGMGKAKKWSLLANYRDTSLIRNYVAFDIAQQMELAYTSENIFVDLYVDGEYYGNYLLCESVEVGSTRVDITNLEDEIEDANPDVDVESLPLGGNHAWDYLTLKEASQKWVNIPNEPADISGGYLLEFEMHSRYVNEVSGFVTDRLQCVVLKSPEYASEKQVKYISGLYQEFEDAVFSETGYNAQGRHYSEYIDMESFVKMYVFQEFVKNLDAGSTSFYLYKEAGDDKFYAAPVWDFDNALGKSYTLHGMSLSDPNDWWACVSYSEWNTPTLYQPTVLTALFRHDDFFAQAAGVWNTEVSVLITDELIAAYTEKVQSLSASATMDCILWNHYSSSDPAAVASSHTSYCKNRVLKFLQDRKAFLDKGFSETAVRVLYDANGGTGAVYNVKALQSGERLTLPAEGFTNGDLYFAGWNTKADGSGTAYPAGTIITLKKNTYRFYAQWVENEEDIYTQINSANLFAFGKMVIEQFFEHVREILSILQAVS